MMTDGIVQGMGKSVIINNVHILKLLGLHENFTLLIAYIGPTLLCIDKVGVTLCNIFQLPLTRQLRNCNLFAWSYWLS